MTIIMVSHDVEFCAKYADLVSMFFDGSVVTTNTPNQFFSRNSSEPHEPACIRECSE